VISTTLTVSFPRLEMFRDHCPVSATISRDRRAAVSPAATLVQNRQAEYAPWPYRHLDAAALESRGWRPTPVRDVILKIHQRCNLACTYCYVYTKADRSWQDRPATMSREIWLAAAAKLADHIRRHRLSRVRVVLHGGEPLMFGAARLRQLVADVRVAVPDRSAVKFCLQTNGVLLRPAMMETLRELDVSVGVSVDGSAAIHDRHRRYRDGRGSFAAVSAAIKLLGQPENRNLFGGLLCTVSLDSDPVGTYEDLAAFRPPMIDFLLPHAHWGQRPTVRPGDPTPYATWLIAAFDRWYRQANGVRVRLFEDIVVALFGGASRSEQVGLSPSAVLVVESDGAIEQVDSLKSTYAGACATGLNVQHDEFDAALTDPGVMARQIGLEALSATCKVCPVVKVCGGGHYAHRYRPGAGFQNPSVYCADMRRLIRHIRGRVVPDLWKGLRAENHDYNA
jgi:uncharacterized protein